MLQGFLPYLGFVQATLLRSKDPSLLDIDAPRAVLLQTLYLGAIILTSDFLAGDEDIETMARQGFTSLVVVAPKLEPTALLTALLQLLNPSASVAVYASSLPPLAECFQKLQATRNFAALHVCPLTSLFLLPSWAMPVLSAFCLMSIASAHKIPHKLAVQQSGVQMCKP